MHICLQDAVGITAVGAIDGGSILTSPGRCLRRCSGLEAGSVYLRPAPYVRLSGKVGGKERGQMCQLVTFST